MGLRKLFRKEREQPSEKTVIVGDYALIANYEHPIQEYLTQFKYYSRNFPRIAKYIETKYPDYTIIDVGANIGDTVALLRTEKVLQKVHLVEGDPIYVNLLEQNIHLFNNIEVHKTFLGEETKNENLSIDNTRGTANLNVGSGEQIKIVKLDELIEKQDIKDIKLLKVDTDGFDFKILRGAFKAIENSRPVLFFEYDAEFLAQQKDDGLKIFEDFRKLGYNKALYYDNFGKFLLSTQIDNSLLLAQLFAYIDRKQDSAFPYYDVCLFHSQDDQLADEIVKKEMNFYKD